jgi:hypothetical protein
MIKLKDIKKRKNNILNFKCNLNCKAKTNFHIGPMSHEEIKRVINNFEKRNVTL